MKIRSTENEHPFTNKLLSNLNAYEIQGLTTNRNKNKFLAGMEAIELEKDEEFNFKSLISLFPPNHIYAKLLLTETLNIPLYILTYKNRNSLYSVYELVKNKNYNITNKLQYIDKSALDIKECRIDLNEEQFIEWWKEVKETVQVKPFVNGAGKRADKTVFDNVLAKYGLYWGGNVDGFVIKENKIVGIIDNLSAGSNIKEYNPALQKWFSVWILHINSVLAQILKVPHLILTIDKHHPDSEIIGLSAIDTLHLYKNSKEIEFFNNVSPDKNIVVSMDNIKNQIFKLLEQAPVPKTKFKQN